MKEVNIFTHKTDHHAEKGPGRTPSQQYGQRPRAGSEIKNHLTTGHLSEPGNAAEDSGTGAASENNKINEPIIK